jgi:hypothetical protein
MVKKTAASRTSNSSWTGSADGCVGEDRRHYLIAINLATSSRCPGRVSPSPSTGEVPGHLRVKSLAIYPPPRGQPSRTQVMRNRTGGRGRKKSTRAKSAPIGARACYRFGNAERIPCARAKRHQSASVGERPEGTLWSATHHPSPERRGGSGAVAMVERCSAAQDPPRDSPHGRAGTRTSGGRRAAAGNRLCQPVAAQRLHSKGRTSAVGLSHAGFAWSAARRAPFWRASTSVEERAARRSGAIDHRWSVKAGARGIQRPPAESAMQPPPEANRAAAVRSPAAAASMMPSAEPRAPLTSTLPAT